MKYNKQPLLSICIPTYNRAEILKRTLTKIVNDVDFDDSVEIVISDNASTDNTQQICQKFCESYSNIFYYRNKKNINDANFFHVLSKATGLYVKLNNDTISFRSGALKEIKNNGIPQEDFYRLKKMIYGEYVKEYDDVSDIARMFLTEHFKGINSFRYLEEIDSVTIEYTKQVLDDIFDESRIILSIVKA